MIRSVLIGLIAALLVLPAHAHDHRRRASSAAARDVGLFPVAFVASLQEPGRSIVGRESSAFGTSSPFSVEPGASNNFVETGIDFSFNSTVGGCPTCTPPTVTSLVGQWFQLVGGVSVLATAGLFIASFATNTPRPFTTSAGYTLALITRQSPNVLGGRGALGMLSETYDTTGPITFEPCQAGNVWAYCVDSDHSVAGGWRACTDTSACTTSADGVGSGWYAAAPRSNDVDFYVLFVVRAGESTGYMLLVDATDLDRPVRLHERAGVTVPAAALFPEINASPGPLTTGQQARTNRIRWIRGALGYDP